MVRVLIAHNQYLRRGGEDEVVEAEARLLSEAGCEVHRLDWSNESMVALGPIRRAATAVWNTSAGREMTRIIASRQIDIVHVHNDFSYASPAVFSAAKRAGAATVQTLHNYRMLCVNGLLLRDGSPCERCAGRRLGWPGVAGACYRDSIAASAVAAARNALHRARHTWTREVDRFIAPSQFAKDKYVGAGMESTRIVVKPHFVRSLGQPCEGGGGFFLFAGRLDREKGLAVLLEAWKHVPRAARLVIAGDGPMMDLVRLAAATNENIETVGWVEPRRVRDLMAEALCVVAPSIAYETFGRVVIEAYAQGTPVITSGGTAAAELVKEGETGWLAPAGDAAELAACVRQCNARRAGLGPMRRQAFALYRARYTPQANQAQLLSIYDELLGRTATDGRIRSEIARRAGKPLNLREVGKDTLREAA